MIFSLGILFPDMLSVPDMQDSKIDLFCTFYSPEARGMCTVPKEKEKLRMKDMEFSKEMEESLRAWVIGDSKHQGLEDNQFRLKQEKKKVLRKNKRLEIFSDVFGHMRIIWNL